ncbi:hypothetical protein PORY_000470 [Pneumocystis oryctolagi]|uniref:Uncharacterized protein n=1 Tax=Pneumocystis oryctolagi TaxID=42067 RepID=A0ACB7CFC1_9ASCO|nr:hypothetical protein PORY_000470 [Pneumocystis oryctolagi]
MVDRPSSPPATIQDVFVSAIASSLNSPKGDHFSPQISFEEEESIPTPFSLHVLTQNFRKLSSRLGIIFQTRDTLASIFQWEVPSKTLSFMCIYTILCINPSLVLLIPTTVFIFGFLLPSYEARYPSDFNSSLLNKETMTPKKSQANGKQSEGRDFTIDMRNIQNSISDYTRFYDKISDFLLKYTSFHDEKASSTVFLLCVIISFFLILFSHWIPIRLIFLLCGWVLILSRNLDVQKTIKVLTEEYKKNQLKHSKFLLNYDFIYNWIDYNYIPPEISRKVITVEVFEFILKTDQENALAGNLLPYNQQLWSGFRRIDMTSEYSEICCKVIKIFVNNHKIYRSLHEFISDWIKSLNFSLHNNCILLSDEILIIVMELTNNLSLNQIKTIINYILEENNYDMLKKSIYSELKKDLSKNRVKSSFFSFYPLLSILHESIDILIIKNILEDLVELYKFILEKVFSNISFFLDDPGTYLIFRIHYKAMLLSNEYISLTDPYKTLEYMKSISMLEKVDPKIIFYTTQCQFVYLQYFDQNSTEFKAEKFSLLMDLILNRIILSLEHTSNNSSWKAGKMQLIDNTNISIAYIYTINNQWMHLINKFSFFNKIKEIVDIFLKYSVENTLEEININQILTFSNLFYIYLRNAEMYELSLFRDVYIFSFIDYVSSNEFDKSLFLNCIQSYSNKKLCEEFIKKKMDNYSILKFKKIVKYLQIIPVDCIEDLAKEKLLNFLFYIDFQFSKQCFMDIVFENRKLIYRIMVTTNSESMLYDIFSLIYLYVSLDNTKTNDDSLITVSNSISKEILRKKILSNDSLISKLIEIIEKYELDIFDQYCRFLCQKNEDEFYISGIVQLILMLFFEIQNELKLSIHAPLGKKINKLAKFFFKIIKKSLKELLSFFQKNNLNFEKILNSKYLFRFFFQLSPSISFTSSDKDFLKQFIFIVSKGCFYYEDVNICLHKKFQDLLSLLLKIYSSKAENYDDILDICVTLISVFKNVQFFYTDKLEVSSYFDFQSISIYYFIQQRLQNIEFQDFKRVSIILSYSSWEIEDVNAVANILCVILLSKIEKENNLQQKYSKLFQTVVFRLVLFAKKTTNLRVLYNFINLFNILLLKKSSHFSLQNLDQLFVIIVTSLSPSVLILNESDITNDDICKGFCRMIFLMLKKNYKKLLKRYHLLTLCFQSLLHLFFYKNTNIKMTKNSTFQRRPNWVLDSSSCSSSSAKIYSDVLLYWVNASQLNKDIKKPNLGSSKTFERAIAKYLLWIIIEYIKLLLHYSINNDVKDVLTLLIMEIFKIFSTNEFEMINNILDNQGKVVFKKLYDNYMKHDKWNEA